MLIAKKETCPLEGFEHPEWIVPGIVAVECRKAFVLLGNVGPNVGSAHHFVDANNQRNVEEDGQGGEELYFYFPYYLPRCQGRQSNAA
jgi:hypothetical protein